MLSLSSVESWSCCSNRSDVDIVVLVAGDLVKLTDMVNDVCIARWYNGVG